MIRKMTALSVVLGVVLVSSAAIPQESPPVPKPTAAPAPEPLKIGKIENAFRLSPRLYSGGDPRGAEDFTALRKLGIKTILSVDGAVPNVEAARKVGIRYVHLPIGYDSVPHDQASRIIKAIQTFPGPVYVHCHHGQHRGPAAAAICGISSEGWTNEQALAWMKQAGTSKDYQGLYASARRFVPPSAEELKSIDKADLPERAPVPALVDLMIQVDQRWDHLKAIQKAEFQTPRAQPDLDPPHEALQLVELFRELSRLPEAKAKGDAFLAAIRSAEDKTARLENAMRAFIARPNSEARKAAESAFLDAGKECASCHASHRNQVQAAKAQPGK